jgi:uncharacterized protein YbjT (DUF2867 family)
MKLLILGGTRFVGRHLVTAALARNHEITLFNRGKHLSAALTGERSAPKQWHDYESSVRDEGPLRVGSPGRPRHT